jgi:hypothetical protein
VVDVRDQSNVAKRGSRHGTDKGTGLPGQGLKPAGMFIPDR